MVKRAILTRPKYEREPYLRIRDPQKQNEGLSGKSGSPLPLYRGEEGDPFPTRPRTSEKKEASTADELLALVEKLPAEDRRLLLDKLALKQSEEEAPRASDRELNLWSAAVHDALNEALGSEDRGEVGLFVVRRQVGSRSAWIPIVDFMRSAKLADLTVAERQSIYSMLAKLLVDHASQVAQRSGAPLGPKLVSACAGSIRGVFERSFPGYLRAGLAPVVARQMKALAGA